MTNLIRQWRQEGMNPRIRMKISQCTLNDIEKFETPGSENCRFAMGQDHSEAGASTIKSNIKNVKCDEWCDEAVDVMDKIWVSTIMKLV